MKKNNLKYWAVLSLVLAFTSCTQDETVVPATSDNPLFQLPGNTRILLSATIDGDWKAESRSDDAGRVEGGSTESTPPVAPSDITMESENVYFQIILPFTTKVEFTPGDGADNLTLSEKINSTYISVDDLELEKNKDNPLAQYALMEAFDDNDYDPEEDDDKVIVADHVMGVAKVHVPEGGNEPPVIHAEMKHAVSRAVVVIADLDKNALLDFSQRTDIQVGVKTRESEPIMGRMDPNRYIWDFKGSSSADRGNIEWRLRSKSVGDGLRCSLIQGQFEGSYLENSREDPWYAFLKAWAIELGIITGNGGDIFEPEAAFIRSKLLYGYIYPTPDVEVMQGEGYGYQEIVDASFTDEEVFTLTIGDDPDGEGPQIAGTYQLPLQTLFANSSSSTRTTGVQRFEAGKSYYIFAQLKNNKLVSATATVGDWTEYNGSADLTGDESKVDEDESTNP